MAFLSRASRIVIAGAVLLGATSAHAFEVKKTTRGALVHWDTPSVAYTIDGSVDAAVTGGSAATLHAMAGWSGTVGAPDLHGALAGASAPQAPGLDHKNGVFFAKDGYAPAGKALAITLLTYDNESGTILDADVVFNGAYAFAVLATPSTAGPSNEVSTVTPSATDGTRHGDEALEVRGTLSTYDLQHVVAHELGHSLGMNDELAKPTSLMYRYSAPNDATVRTPSSDDVDGLSELYGKDLSAKGEGCGGATVAPNKPSHDASRIAMLATLGLALFVLLRGHRRRTAFVVGAIAGIALLLPRLDGSANLARAAGATGHARARVVSARTTASAGLFTTSYALTTTSCRASACPRAGHGASWGGTIGNVTQEVNGAYAPALGDEVDVSFEGIPSNLHVLTPLAGRTVASDLAVRVVTLAR